MKSTPAHLSRFSAAILLSCAQLAFSQSPPTIKSPEVQPDGTVVLRYYDPGAKVVQYRLEGVPDPIPMTRDDQGVWSVMTAILPPDYYGYEFLADGARQLDPNNPNIKPNLLDIQNVVHVTGTPPPLWEVSDVPHGIVHHHFFHSAVVGDQRDFYVYTPPNYDPNAQTKYPVLYLLHGFSDDASGWTAVGKANVILDNLIAQNKAKPMIVVMPLGYGDPAVLAEGWKHTNMDKFWLSNIQKFRDSLLTEVMPQVERQYRISTDRNDRAIAGLSMGGAESLYTGLNTLDRFAWIGGLSSATGHFNAANFPALPSGKDATQVAGRSTKEAAGDPEQIRLLWIACGVDDHLIGDNRHFIAWLQSIGLKPVQVETPGAHTWMVWRRNLIAFAPQLFQNR
jgi:enterochelin esterase family protein